MEYPRLTKRSRHYQISTKYLIFFLGTYLAIHLVDPFNGPRSSTFEANRSVSARAINSTTWNSTLTPRHLPNLQPTPNTTFDHILLPRAPLFQTKPASDLDYLKASEKGKLLSCWMTDPSLAGPLAKSKWTRFDQLSDWGWTAPQGQVLSKAITVNYAGERDEGIVSLVGKDTPNGMTVRLGHKKNPAREPIIDEEGKTWTFPATLAEFGNNYYIEKGVIVGDYNWGPNYFIQNDMIPNWNPTTNRAPALFQLSDIWYLTWSHLTSSSPTQRKGLKAIIQHNIVNIPTQAIVARVLQIHWPEEEASKVGHAPGWPGKRIEEGMEGFEALLGTTNIWGVPWMLIQRSGEEELGRKKVTGLRIWNEHPGKNFYQPNVIVEVGNIE